MTAIFKYLQEHYKSLSFAGAFVLFLMDLSGFIGEIGYHLYYPMLIAVCVYCIKERRTISPIYIIYLYVCLLSIALNYIKPFYNIEQRFVVYIILLLAFSLLINSRKIALMRLHLLHMMTIFSVVTVTLNYIIFQLGGAPAAQMEIYEATGIYWGSTANNEMGTLGSIAVMYVVVFLINFIKRLKWWETAVLLGCLFCCAAMMLLASSRTSLLCTVAAIVLIVVYYNRDSMKKIVTAGVLLLVAFVVSFALLKSEMRGILEYKQGGNTSHIDTNSRKGLWDVRIKEFNSSPVYGIWFATISNPNEFAKKNGTIEAGSGWMSVLSQTGILGAICIGIIIIPNIIYLFRSRSKSYCYTWMVGLTCIFLISPISEAYITTISAVLCCLFWLNYSVIDSFRTGLLRQKDLELYKVRNRHEYNDFTTEGTEFHRVL
ncbi:MAG: O-antigen ligase family protein [Bacteroides sp.]|nr:O-antigen ligase family protein [Bacteroides sp.]